MTDYVIMPKADYQGACDAIRAKTGKTDPIKSGDMVTEIGEISGGGSGKLASIVDRTITEVKSEDLEGITEIGLDAFYYCSKLTSITIPDGVTRIRSSAFSGCTGLTSIAFPNSVQYFDSFVFSSCTGLTSITFPNSVKSISNNIFSNCTKLATINVPWAEGAVANAPWGATNATINYNYTGE